MIDTMKVLGSMAEIVMNVSISFRAHNSDLITIINCDSLNLEQMIKAVEDGQCANYIEAAKQDLNKLAAAVEKKVTGRILFSDTAVKELNGLVIGLITYINNVQDYLSTGNKVLQQSIKDDAKQYAQLARDYATKHEERLIQGVCQPRSSTLYLDTLSGIEGIFYNLYCMAVKTEAAIRSCA